MSRSISQIFVLNGFQGCTVMDSIKTSSFSSFTLSDDSYVGTNSIVYKLHVFSSLNYLCVFSLERAVMEIMRVHDPWSNSFPG